MNKKETVNQCYACWKEGQPLHEVTYWGREGIRTILLCDECYDIYLDLEKRCNNE